jgi:uncharacterized membrane protein
MDIAALTGASPLIQTHAYAAFAALGLGAVQLALPKGTPLHRASGGAWAGLMLLVAGSSLFIHTFRTFGPFSLIHVLSIWTLFAIPRLVLLARRGLIVAHARGMRHLYVLALIVTGLFTLWPGRIMNLVVFGP